MKKEPKKEPKKEIKVGVWLSEISTSTLDGSIDDVVNRLKKWKKEYTKSGFKNICIRVDEDYYDNNVSISLVGDRLETDAEFKMRIKIETEMAEQRKIYEEQDKIAKEKKDLRDYKRLKKKFENNGSKK